MKSSKKAGGGHFNSKTQGYHSKLSQLLKICHFIADIYSY